MKALPVLFTGLAEEDLDQIEDYIAARDPAAAARVRTAIVRQSISLGMTPEKGMRLNEPQDESETGVRLWPVVRYRNYLILYRIEPNQIRVLRVLRAAQDWTLGTPGWLVQAVAVLAVLGVEGNAEENRFILNSR
jgi:plasmid stabilization system protein ParE